MSLAASFLNSSVNTVRRTRRAYIGAHVMAFEFARDRTANRLAKIKTMGDLLVAKGGRVEKDAVELFGTAKDKVVEVMPFTGDDVKTINVTPKVKKKAKPAKRTDMSTDRTAKAKAPTQKKQIQKKSTPKTVAKKTTAKPSPKAAQAGKIITDKYAAYNTAVAKYDTDANPIHVKAIVDHLGVALTSRDGKYVACSDPAERETVAKSWLLKKLGLEADMDALDAKVGDVCETMKADRLKNRVTFYYLLAKNEGKLGTL